MFDGIRARNQRALTNSMHLLCWFKNIPRRFEVTKDWNRSLLSLLPSDWKRMIEKNEWSFSPEWKKKTILFYVTSPRKSREPNQRNASSPSRCCDIYIYIYIHTYIHVHMYMYIFRICRHVTFQHIFFRARKIIRSSVRW